MNKTTLVLALAVIVCLAVPAYAEVQNVQVSGELTVRGLARTNYDLEDGSEAAAANNNSIYGMSTVRLDVDADLTDNVSTKVSLVNQRDLGTVVSTSTENRVGINEAYVTLKELLYSPLTLKVGRQALWYGKGFIVGSTILAGTTARDPESSITAEEYTAYTGFDAITAKLDYDPWTIDLLWSKIDEQATYTNDDIDLYGVNVGYKFASYDAEAEGYLFSKLDSYSAGTDYGDTDTTHTIGLRGSVIPIADLNLWGEIAYQAGDYATRGKTNDRSAWALDVGADYTLADWTWVPKFGLEYVYYSGDPTEINSYDHRIIANDYEAWDPMFRGRFFSAIRDFQGPNSLNNPTDPNDQDAFKNQHAILLTGTVKPWEPVTIQGLYGYFIAAEEYVKGRDDQLGHELDLIVNYDYTEDISFNLLGAIFLPGDYFDGETTAANKSADNASEIVGTMKVSF